MLLVLIFSLVASIPLSDVTVPHASTVRAGWDAYVHQNRWTNGVIHYTLITGSLSRTMVTFTGFNGSEFGVIDSQGATSAENDEVIGCNNSYAFTLNRDPQTLKWRLTNIVITSIDSSLRATLSRHHDHMKRRMFELSNSQEQLLIDLRESRFEIQSIVPTPDQDWLLVDIAAKDFDPRRKRLTSAATLKCFNRPPYFLPVHCSMRVEWPDQSAKPHGARQGKIVNEYTYDDSSDPPRLIGSKRTRHVPGLANHADVTYVHRFELTDSSPDIDRFFLSHYGLAEPHGVTWPKPTPYWLYGTILAVVMIFLAILLIRWALKPKAA